MSDSPWHTSTLGQKAKFRRGISYDLGTLSDSSDGARPYLNMKSFLKDGGYNERGLKYFSGTVSEQDVLGDNCLVIANTDVTRDGDIIGAPALVPASLAGFDVVCSHHVTALRLADDCDARFLFHLLRLPRLRAAFRQHARGTTVLMLDPRSIEGIEFDHPSDVREQRRIAEILDTLDTTIRQTEAIIEKLKQVKQGLLHDLLTRGIDANGELRPPQSQAPHLYKESPLGWLPKEWEAVPVSDLAENLDGRRLPIKETERRAGVYPYFGASGIIDWVESFILDGDYVLLGEDGENVISRHLPLAFRVTGKIWVNNHAHIYEPRRGVDIRFLVEVLEAKDYGPWVSGSAQPKLTQDALARMSFQRPPPQEQVLIADRIETVASRIATESGEVNKMRALKAGLMDDLLTGRVRVTPLLA